MESPLAYGPLSSHRALRRGLGGLSLLVSAALLGCSGEPSAPESAEPLGSGTQDVICQTIQRGTFGTVEDAELTSLTPGLNSGTVTTGFAGVPVAGDERRVVLKFDLSFIPVGSSVQSATLTVAQTGSTVSAGLYVHRLAASWTEGTATWTLLGTSLTPSPAAAQWNQGIGKIGLRSFNLLSLAQLWVAGTVPNQGVVLKHNTTLVPSGTTTFQLSEGTVSARRPKLAICYTPPETCTDGLQNQDETGADCGGTHCAPCADGLGCVLGADCVSGVCGAGLCQIATCADGVANGSETGVDCGGGCTSCADGEPCAVAADCQSGSCGGGVCQCVDPLALPINATPPALLSQTGLYANILTRTVASHVRPFAPQYPLWSDGSVKTRWAYIPACTQIDTSDMDNWSFPVGTRLWKEFVVAGKLVETRYMERTGPGVSDWQMAPYRWNVAGTDASYFPQGASNVGGTQHDIPTKQQCYACHATSARVLGFDAIQLSHAGSGETMASLSSEGLLTVPASQGFTVPGDPTTAAALGYLHGNCGNCHFAGHVGWTLYTKLSVYDADPTLTDTYTSGVGQASPYSVPGMTLLIDPGSPATSVLSHRMGQRGNTDQMPPLGSEVVDAAGQAAVEAWITALP
jgi:hypothetical protein